MKILVVNGIPGTNYLDYENAIANEITQNKKHQIDYFVLRNMNIHYCTGCWDCWLKTPGLCAIKDDHEQILSRLPHVDLILVISPIIVGYESALLKKFKDRIIPFAHPYISIHNGEQHHFQRYKNSPSFSTLFIKDEDTTTEDIEIIEECYQRIALNFKSSLVSFNAIDSIGGVVDVFNNL